MDQALGTAGDSRSPDESVPMGGCGRCARFSRRRHWPEPSVCRGRRSNLSHRHSCILTSRRPSRAPNHGIPARVEEKQIVIDDQGTKLQAMTFNGSIPGPLMVVHEGDYVEVTLVNPDTNSMPHNIDFHAATGASGGADLTLINPGEEAVLRWKATRTGVFVYHCIPGGHGPLAYRVRHERRRDGAAARRTQGCRGKAAALRPGLLHWRA